MERRTGPRPAQSMTSRKVVSAEMPQKVMQPGHTTVLARVTWSFRLLHRCRSAPEVSGDDLLVNHRPGASFLVLFSSSTAMNSSSVKVCMFAGLPPGSARRVQGGGSY